MAITVTNATSQWSVQTASITGLTATTKYTLQITFPSGGTANIPFTSDGSGNASINYLPGSGGTAVYSVLSTPAVVQGPTNAPYEPGP